jgi:DNA-binding transcriptional regulator YiaG
LRRHQAGEGYRRIAQTLKASGIDTSARTIERVVKGQGVYAYEGPVLTCCMVNAIRSLNSMTVEAFATHLAVTPPQVESWESGIDTPADPDALDRLHHLATHFGPVEDLPLDADFRRQLFEALAVIFTIRAQTVR